MIQRLLNVRSVNLKNRFLKSKNLGKFTTFDSNFPASRENNKHNKEETQ